MPTFGPLTDQERATIETLKTAGLVLGDLEAALQTSPVDDPTRRALRGEISFAEANALNAILGDVLSSDNLEARYQSLVERNTTPRFAPTSASYTAARVAVESQFTALNQLGAVDHAGLHTVATFLATKPAIDLSGFADAAKPSIQAEHDAFEAALATVPAPVAEAPAT